MSDQMSQAINQLHSVQITLRRIIGLLRVIDLGDRRIHAADLQWALHFIGTVKGALVLRSSKSGHIA